MAFHPDNNPTTNPEKNGKKHRYAVRTSCVRTLRTDPEAERAMWRVKQILSRPSEVNALELDTPSYSLIVRRSLRLYANALLKGDVATVEREQRLVRESSHVPAHRHCSVQQTDIK
jgi:hypothetical protein